MIALLSLWGCEPEPAETLAASPPRCDQHVAGCVGTVDPSGAYCGPMVWHRTVERPALLDVPDWWSAERCGEVERVGDEVTVRVSVPGGDGSPDGACVWRGTVAPPWATSAVLRPDGGCVAARADGEHRVGPVLSGFVDWSTPGEVVLDVVSDGHELHAPGADLWTPAGATATARIWAGLHQQVWSASAADPVEEAGEIPEAPSDCALDGCWDGEIVGVVEEGVGNPDCDALVGYGAPVAAYALVERGGRTMNVGGSHQMPAFLRLGVCELFGEEGTNGEFGWTHAVRHVDGVTTLSVSYRGYVNPATGSWCQVRFEGPVAACDGG